MTYPEAENYLNNLPAFHHVGAAAYKPGLERMEAMLSAMGHPERKWRSVHIAGTNGKGSTSSLIAASLQESGARTGLYTSPHLVDWRERIRIDGEMIRQEYVCAWVEQNRSIIEEQKPSYFEALTALAFCYFADEKVDWAVVECGLGGRLDSTNVIAPELSVITNIGLDHTAILGDTRAKIAEEKAGIIKGETPCVVGERDAETEPIYRAHTSHLIWASEQGDYGGDCDLTGDYQRANMRTAAAALGAIGIAPNFHRAAQITGLRGRWEVLCEKPLTICDTGHNSHGIRTYVEQLRALMQDGKHAYLRIVLGMVSDKDVDEVLRLLPRDAFYYWVEADTERAIPAEEMLRRGLMNGLIGKACGSVEDGRRVIETEAEEDDVVFVAGSNFVVGEWLRHGTWNKEQGIKII